MAQFYKQRHFHRKLRHLLRTASSKTVSTVFACSSADEQGNGAKNVDLNLKPSSLNIVWHVTFED
jgi:hypothetical protein